MERDGGCEAGPEHDVWPFTLDVLAAVDYARRHEDRYVCDISCFSCGPDAILHHRLRTELEGQPFCFLEIDSHTGQYSTPIYNTNQDNLLVMEE